MSCSRVAFYVESNAGRHYWRRFLLPPSSLSALRNLTSLLVAYELRFSYGFYLKNSWSSWTLFPIKRTYLCTTFLNIFNLPFSFWIVVLSIYNFRDYSVIFVFGGRELPINLGEPFFYRAWKRFSIAVAKYFLTFNSCFVNLWFLESYSQMCRKILMTSL